MSFEWELGIAAIVSSAVGFLGGYTGIAGGPFIVFLLSVVLSYSQHTAQGTVLAMMLGPMSILPVVYGWSIVRRRMKEILIVICSYMMFSWVGAEIAYLFSSPLLKLIFGVFVIILGIIYIIFAIKDGNARPGKSDRTIPPILMVLIGAFIGIIGGMVGIGAGILLVPILTMGLGLKQREAQTMSLAILLPPVSLGAVVKYGIMENDVIWPVAGITLLTYIITSGLGYKLSGHHRTVMIRTVLAVLLIIAGVIDIIGTIRI